MIKDGFGSILLAINLGLVEIATTADKKAPVWKMGEGMICEMSISTIFLLPLIIYILLISVFLMDSDERSILAYFKYWL